MNDLFISWARYRVICTGNCINLEESRLLKKAATNNVAGQNYQAPLAIEVAEHRRLGEQRCFNRTSHRP